MAPVKREKDVTRRFAFVAVSIVFMGCLLLVQSDWKALGLVNVVAVSEDAVVNKDKVEPFQREALQLEESSPRSVTQSVTMLDDAEPTRLVDTVVGPTEAPKPATLSESAKEKEREDMSEKSATIVNQSTQPAKQSDKSLQSVSLPDTVVNVPPNETIVAASSTESVKEMASERIPEKNVTSIEVSTLPIDESHKSGNFSDTVADESHNETTKLTLPSEITQERRSEGSSGDNKTTDETSVQPADDVANARVVSWEGWYQMQTIIRRFWKGNQFCEEVDRQKQTSEGESTTNPLVVMNISFGCAELFQRSELGTGNYISLFYAMRLASYAYDNVDLHFTCPDAEDSKKNLILPWLTGHFPRRQLSSVSNSAALYANMTSGQVCGNYDQVPVAYMYKEIQHDLRRMAIGLVGVPSPEHPSAKFVKEYKTSHEYKAMQSPQQGAKAADTKSQPMHMLPLNESPLYAAPEFELDDAVIHFRCGDLMALNHPSFGFMSFAGYVRHISPEARSIGILTQPFEDSAQGRKEDSNWRIRDRCRIAVTSLVEYIKVHHPLAAVRIHNNPNETITLTYARMIMANQTIAGISSFGVFPAIASFGTGYVRRPDYPKAPNKWLASPPIDQITDNVVLFDEPNRIMCREIKRLWESEGEEGVLNWFWNGEERIGTNVSSS